MPLNFPITYLLPKDLDPGYMAELESQIPSLTYNINEAEIVLGKISQPARAKWELKNKNVWTEDIQPASTLDIHHDGPGPPTKRRKFSALAIQDIGPSPASDSDASTTASILSNTSSNIIKVVKLNWFLDCLKSNTILPLDNYLVYQGRKVSPPEAQVAMPQSRASDIWERMRSEGRGQKSGSSWGNQHGYTSSLQHPRTHFHSKRPELKQESTSEHDRIARMPPIPDFLHTTYSCQRPTPKNPPNAMFIEKLKEIRTIRTLAGNKTGVRAYSTAIATLAAYPHSISCMSEVERLPGCSTKIAWLWDQWRDRGSVQEVEDAKMDSEIRVLKLFYDIWGVGETTAREFYKKGWRDLDDVVEYGWDTLTRVQQIGVKFYDEFLLKIPRAEVESIGQMVLQHANKLHEGYQMVIVGGYRRGKEGSGDADVVLSHPDPACTLNFVEAIVNSLDNDGYITHTLTLSTTTSERGQVPVSWKGEGRPAGTGFDTLDKALVVWQDPVWDKSASQKNPNPHRRVDIIISPWQTAGCAVLGWSGATTFERDLRRYCKHEKGLKFDSSGVRSRTDGRWVDVESDLDGPAPDMLTAERRVFSSLGLEWRPPEERCTDG